MGKIKRSVLEKRLAKGEVRFEFEKVDGSKRAAYGTTRLDLIPEEWHPKGETKSHLGTPYFDLDLNEWRAIANSVERVKIIK
jgi:hypothetical protein